ncbi:MAG: hypothetical protein HUJ75_07635, partial [Parasporobacterium sp.]|nr:hypothetical protein [Parasporobacterium sp.]
DMAEESILLLETHSELEKNSFYRNVKAKERRRANDFDTMLMMLETGRDYAVFPMVFNAAASSKMVCFDLPSKYAFNYRTMCAAKAHNSKPEIRKIMNYIKKNKDKFEFQM